MTLEDFFTLTEMKDGLTAPARVKELVNAMQKEKDCIMKNVNDATRQWSTVAGTIAATEDKDCLDLFVQLDGLWFIDRWLKDSQKFANDTSNGFVEESITALLRALEKLHVDYEKSISHGLWMTVKDLLGHNSSRIQERARALFDSWKQNGDAEAVSRTSHGDGIKGSTEVAGEGGHAEGTNVDNGLCQESGNEEKHVELTRDDTVQPTCSDIFLEDKVDDVQTQLSDKEKNLAQETVKDECSPNPIDLSMMIEPAKDNLSIKEDSLACHLEHATSTEACTVVGLKQAAEESPDFANLNECTDQAKQIQINSPPNKSDEVESSSLSGSGSPLLDQDGNAQEPVTEPGLCKNIDAKNECHSKDSSVDNVRMDTLEGKSGTDDDKVQKLEDPDTSLSTNGSGSINKVEEETTDESDMENVSGLLKHAMIAGAPHVVQKRSDLDLDDIMVDALEVARQVAIEVEREVMGHREPSCGSYKRTSDGTNQSDKTKSMSGKVVQPIEAMSIEATGGPNASAEASLKKEELLNNTETQDIKSKICAEDVKSSQVTKSGIEPEINTGKALGDFDLNEGACSDDVDQTGNSISTPIPVISTSKTAAAPGLPISPIKFEGAQGWKGCAATSAFRPASPRRILEVEQNISKQRQNCLDFDLNVSEASEDKTMGPIPGKQVLIESGLPGVESSVEAGVRKSDMIELDLNQISTDSDAPSDWQVEGLSHHRNGHQNLSSASSSPSMPLSLKNIDLNDQPSLHNDSSELHPYLGKSSFLNLNASGGLRSDCSVISIMGTRVEVSQKESVPRGPLFPNGRVLDPALDVNLAVGAPMDVGSKVPLPFAHPSVFGYSNFTTGPAAGLSSTIYGSPFLMGMTGTSLSLNSAGPSRSDFDLNLMTDGGNREPEILGLGPLFNPGQRRSSDALLRANSLPFLGSVGAGKRKEPDGGWEPDTFPIKNQQNQPPRK